MLIEPKILKGFRDFLPEEAAARKEIVHKLQTLFESFGFQTIDTPVLEYTEVLLGKGGGETDKQVYRFNDQGGRDVAMRFDLTVPFARFMGRNEAKLPLPFKRYHIDKVWRGENTQRGRYREFTQCDFDIVGTDAVSADLEILLMMHEAFETLGIDDITIKINHRGVFSHFLQQLEIDEQLIDVMRSIDKLAKIGEEKVRELLLELINEKKVDLLLRYIKPEESFEGSIEMMRQLCGGDHEEIRRLEVLYRSFQELGVEDRFFLDTSIMRGLDYYTGIVYETFFNDLPEIGSVCSGGRYDNLASLYSKTKLPGVGSSIGLDRLVAALQELGRMEIHHPAAQLAVFCMNPRLQSYYQSLAREFRRRGISCDVFLEPKKLGPQFKAAERKNIPYALICGEDEKERGKVSMKDLNKRINHSMISIEEAAEIIVSANSAEKGT